ncbi:hypothetical protein QFC19_001116 [Naganishia cerealis]|uniref:Uncharacterized protein n=1 Tax=Naganishia cerealis TaxID=610337 RepID=A0ACC2WIX2_9TREE|nr:hypothetical protein QFC19_001116 [Naganishia cerealis]
MVAYNITIDDTSPMIQYSPGWVFRHPPEIDTKTGLYFRGTFASSQDDAQSATLKFNGTGIWAYGAKRPNHGSYLATLDGVGTYFSGLASDPELFQTVLFSQTGLDPNTEHTLTLANAYSQDPGGNKFYFDVDYYIVQTEEIAPAGQELKLETVLLDDRVDFFNYSSNWDAKSLAEYRLKTGHFVGTSLAVYGGVNSNHGNYTVNIDGVTTRYNGYYNGSLTGDTIMFLRTHLEDTTHNVIITNEGVNNTNFFGIDYVQFNYTLPSPTIPTASAADTTGLIMATPSTGVPLDQPADKASDMSNSLASADSSVNASLGSANSSAAPSHHKMSHGVLAGIIIGSIATIACLALLAWLCFLKRQKKKTSPYRWDDNNRRLNLGSAMSESFKPIDLGDTPISLYQDTPYAAQNARWPSSQGSPQMMQQSHFMPGEVFAHLPGPPASNSTSYYPYGQSVNPPSDIGDSGEYDINRADMAYQAYSGTGSSRPAHNTAPSSAAIPSILGDPAEIRVASQACSMRPELQSVSSMRRSPPGAEVTRNVSVNSVTPSSLATTGSFGRRKQRGVALPLTASPPVATLSEQHLRQMRMIVQGRPQDFGPVSISDDNRSVSATELPPDYVQAFDTSSNTRVASVMSQLDLSEETMVFYRLIKSVTICAVSMIILASLLIAYDKSEKAAEEELRKGKDNTEDDKKKKEMDGFAPELVKRIPVWEDDGSHPSHKLTTPDARPKLQVFLLPPWPFPLGKVAPDKSSLWFESGTAPQVGHFGKPGEAWAGRLQEAQRARQHATSMEKKRIEGIRQFEYDQRRKQWKRRLSHLKALCIVIILSYLSTKLALVALAMLIWRVINSETARLMKPEPGPGIREPYAARWGTQTQGRKTPYGAEKKTTYPGVGMTYLYEPSGGTASSLRSSATIPLRLHAPIQPLLTSTDERLAGREGVLGDETKGIGTETENFKGRSGTRGSDSLGGATSMSGLSGLS